MKVRLIIALALLLSSFNFVKPANAHSIIFRDYYNIMPSGNYCDARQVTFQYDRSRYFSFGADYTYYINVNTFDSNYNLLQSESRQSIGWSPSGSLTESAGFAIIFANEDEIRIDRSTAFYSVEFGYTYEWSGQTALQWHINISCNVAARQTYDAHYTLDDAPFD